MLGLDSNITYSGAYQYVIPIHCEQKLFGFVSCACVTSIVHCPEFRFFIFCFSFRDCLDNKTVWTTFHLSQTINLDDLLNVSKVRVTRNTQT